MNVLIWGGGVVVLAGLILREWYQVRRAKRKAAEEREKRQEQMRTYVPKLYPSIIPPHHPCGHGTVADAELNLGKVLRSDISSLMVWDVFLNGQVVHHPMGSGLRETFGRVIRTVDDVECIARRYPKSEWLIRYTEPLQSLVYQRHAEGKWVLVRAGDGMF